MTEKQQINWWKTARQPKSKADIDELIWDVDFQVKTQTICLWLKIYVNLTANTYYKVHKTFNLHHKIRKSLISAEENLISQIYFSFNILHFRLILPKKLFILRPILYKKNYHVCLSVVLYAIKLLYKIVTFIMDLFCPLPYAEGTY